MLFYSIVKKFLKRNICLQTIISGMGELHLDIYVERIKREYKVCKQLVVPRHVWLSRLFGQNTFITSMSVNFTLSLLPESALLELLGKPWQPAKPFNCLLYELVYLFLVLIKDADNPDLAVASRKQGDYSCPQHNTVTQLIYFVLNSAKNHLQFCLILYWESKQLHN
jgi:hypothetical protein